MPDQSNPTGNRGYFAPPDELGLLSRHRASDVQGSSVNQAFSRSHYPSFNAPDGSLNVPGRFSDRFDASYSFPNDQSVAPDTSFNVAEASQYPNQYQHDSSQEQFAGRRDQSGPLEANRQQQWRLAPANQQPALNERPPAHGHQQLSQALNPHPPSMPNPHTSTSAYQLSTHNPQPPVATSQPTTPGAQTPSGQIERSFRCQYCPWSFHKEALLAAHILDVHWGREHRCKYCNKKLSSTSSRISRVEN